MFTDTSSFGRKMLEKMGWKTGQGLGLKNDGTTSHVKISIKDDNLGIGATIKDSESGWLNNSKSYQEVLDRLTKSSEVENAIAESKSDRDEKKSKKSKKEKKKKLKVEKSKKGKSSKSKSDSEICDHKPTVLKSAHRAKFIRNKAVSSYSEAHLKEILGGINI